MDCKKERSGSKERSVEGSEETGEGKALSTTERNVKSVPPIPRHKLNIPSLTQGQPMLADGLKQIREHLKGQGLLDEKLVSQILKTSLEAFKKESNLVEVRCSDAVIIGDIHGQFYDLLNILERVCGDKPPQGTTSYVFLGDYVDRGSFSTECILYLCSLKLLAPKNVFLLRGNHESEKLNKNFNFHEEFTQKYSEDLFQLCQQMFNSMPLCAVVNNKYFCAHGGISPEAKVLSDINKIKRHKEIPQTMTDLLWSDPCEDYEDNESTKSSEMFQFNQQRQTSYRYNHAAIRKFLQKNKLTSVIRGHEVQLTGVKLFKHKEDKFPSVITVFSAPNYVDSYKNKGAVIVISEKDMDLRSYNAVDHPFLLPEGLNAFTWSLPFVGEKINEMLVNMLNVCTKEELEANKVEEKESVATPSSSPKHPHMTAERREVVKNKIKAVAKMGTYYKTLQMENDAIMKLKVLSPGGRLAPGTLSGGRSSIMSAIEKNMNLDFHEVKEIDAENEKMPSDTR